MAPKKAKKKEAPTSSACLSKARSRSSKRQSFTIMDQNRGGFTDKSDLKDTFAALGTDPEETILNAFKVFDPEGTGVLGGEEMKYHLMSQADKFTEDEVNQMLTNFPLDVAGNLDYKNLCYVITHGEDRAEVRGGEMKQKDEKKRSTSGASACK